MSVEDELKAMTARAQIAEARVAELLEEQKRIGGDKPLTGSLSAAADDSKLRKRAEAAEAEREDLRAKKDKLESELEEEEEKLRRALEALDQAKGDKQRISQLENDLRQAQEAATSQPPPPPPPAQDTSKLEEQIKSKDEELAGLASALREKDAVVAELSRRVESIPLLEAERDGLKKEVEGLRSQVEQAQAPPLPPPPPAVDPEVVEHLKTELEEMAQKVKASADEAQQLTQENLQMLQQMAALKKENDELAKKADEAKDEISIVSQARADGTQPKTLPPRPAIPQDTAETMEVPPAEAAASWPSSGPIREVPPEAEPSGEVIVGTPVSAPPAEPVPAPVSETVPEPPAEDVPEDSLPELEPLPPVEPATVPKPRKGGFVWKFFLFLILVGAAFFAAWHFYPELFDFIKDKPPAEEAVAPETAPAPAPSVPEEPAEATPEETPEETPPEETKPEELQPPEEEPEEKPAKKKSRKKKRKPKKTAKVIEDRMSSSEAKRQIRRLLASKDLGEAQKMLAEWVRKKPRDAGLHYLYGRLYLMQGKKSRAVDQLEEAIDIAPRMSSAYHDLGAVYLQMGDNESACEALGQFVRLKPDHSRAPAIKALMKKIKCK